MSRLEPSSPSPSSATPGERGAARLPQVAELLEIYLAQAQHQLRHGPARQPAVKQARAWLRRRQVAEGDWHRLPLGVLPEAAVMEAVLGEAGFLPEEIAASKLLADPRLAGRLVGPIRDAQGRLVSFWARHPQGHSPRYLIKGPWREELAVAGLDVALPALGAEGDLLVVSDFAEAVLLQYHGFRPVAALGGPGTQMTARRWQRLAEQGVTRVTMALSGPHVREELLAALDAAWAAERAPQVSVVLPEQFAEASSWSAWVDAHGVEAFGQMLQAVRMPAYRYCAQVLLEVYQAGSPWTDSTREAAWTAAHLFYGEHAGGCRTQELDAHFVPCIVEALQRDWQSPAPPCEPIEPPLEAPAEAAVAPPEPLRSLAVDLADWSGLWERPKPRLRQRMLPGLRGLVVVSADARLMRSALAWQVATDLVRENPEACVVWLSRRWSCGELLVRLLARRARIAWKRLRRGASTLSEPAHQRLHQSQAELAEWGRRLLVLDRHRCPAPSLACLTEAWHRLQQETGATRGLLCLDDVSDWPGGLLRELAERTGADAVLATVAGAGAPWSEEADLVWRLSANPERGHSDRSRESRPGLVPSTLLVTDAEEMGPVARVPLIFSPRSWRFRPGTPVLPPPPEPAAPTSRRPAASDYCPLHRCSVWDCFCFD